MIIVIHPSFCANRVSITHYMTTPKLLPTSSAGGFLTPSSQRRLVHNSQSAQELSNIPRASFCWLEREFQLPPIEMQPTTGAIVESQ
jgi:hypothetical protein